MLGWLVAGPAERRLLGARPGLGPTAYVIAAMTFAMVVVAAAGLALAGAARTVAASVEHRYTVQIAGGGDRLGAVLARVRAIPGVADATAVPEAELRQTLERWLGPAGGSEDLPVPALIHLDLKPGADPAAVADRAGRLVPGARMVAHDSALRPLLRSLSALQWLAVGLVLLMGAASAAVVVLAARGALDTHRGIMEVMHGIGATDLQITHLFQRKIALDAAAGSLAGAAAAAVVIAVLAGGGAALAGEFAGRAVLGAGDVAVLAAIPPAVVVLAAWVARLAVMAALRRSL